MGARLAIHPGQTACDETHAAQFSRWGLGRRSIPADRVASRRSSLRFGRNTPGPVLPVGAPPSRALSAGPPPGELAPPGELGLTGLGAHAGSTTGCSPRRCASLIVGFRSKYTRYASLTRLVSRAPHRPRRSRGFHHRLFTASLRAAHRCVSVGIHQVCLPHAPCQPGASRTSALTRVSPPAASRRPDVPGGAGRRFLRRGARGRDDGRASESGKSGGPHPHPRREPFRGSVRVSWPEW